MITIYGRTMVTYDDIPEIMNGKLPFDDGLFGEKWYVLKLPNGKYATYLSTEEKREGEIKRIIEHCKFEKDYGETKSQVESYLRFKLFSKDEAEEWLLGSEICSLLEKRGYTTKMWSQLGSIGGITATKDGERRNVVYAYASKKKLKSIIEQLQQGVDLREIK